MNDMKKGVERFFDELEVFEDLKRGHCYKIFIKQSIFNFLENETKDTAFAVYRTFFDSYRIILKGESNPFIDLLDVLKSYEENAATLIDKQRDHYIHSVNVFILGLCIFAENKRFRLFFREAAINRDDYRYAYETKNEEFFYRWGLASLFHDVGYPVEIVGRQINKFVDFAANAGYGDENVNVQFSFSDFDKLNSIKEVIPKRKFTECYWNFYEDCVYIDTLKPVDLLAHRLSVTLGVSLKDIKFALDDFVNVMARYGFIDHGYYSALIVLKWYGYLIQSANYKPEYFFWPVLDSASAILLHNCYKNMLQKKPFKLGPLSPKTHPIAYLLILCDELQEWNRKAYGIKDKLLTLAADARINITDDMLKITYITHNNSLPEDFCRKKKKLLYELLKIDEIFKDLSVHSKTISKSALPQVKNSLAPRPKLEELEALARAIHDLYNEKQKERYPGNTLKYPSFDTLPDSLKYSNLRQAMDIPEKLRLMGFTMHPLDKAVNPVLEIPKEYVEDLAKREHEDWVAERKSTGWTKGKAVDAEKKLTPYLVPYSKLSEEIKQLDRDPIENIPVLLKKIGMAVVKDKD